MKSENTATRLQAIMNRRGLRQVDILELARPFCEKYDVKLNKSDLSQYVSGKVVPGQDKLFVLGCALGVNEAWLMGYDVPESKDAKFPRGDPDLETAVVNIESERLTHEWLLKFKLVHDKMEALEAKIRYLSEDDLQRLFPILESTVEIFWDAFRKGQERTERESSTSDDAEDEYEMVARGGKVVKPDKPFDADAFTKALDGVEQTDNL